MRGAALNCSPHFLIPFIDFPSVSGVSHIHGKFPMVYRVQNTVIAYPQSEKPVVSL